MKKVRRLLTILALGTGFLFALNHAPFNAFSYAASLPKLIVQDSAISSQTKQATSLAPIVKKVSASVVNIYSSKKVKETMPALPFDDPFFRQFFGNPWGGEPAPRERRQQSLGSGVIVSDEGYILTNNHVVEGADEIKVALADEKTVLDAKIIGADPQTDVAVLKVDRKHLPAITLTDSDKLEVGDLVLAVGNPFGVGQTVTSGIVSAKGRGEMGIVDYEDFIQTDASINPGNSGGALVDAEGRLVGLCTAILSRSGGNNGVGFAVPINLARYVMERLVSDGKVTRGFMGVRLQPLNEDLAKEFKISDQEGALVREVTSRSPADDAGIKEGDVIVEFNGKKVSDYRHLRMMVAQTAPGTKVPLHIIRDGKEQTVTVKLGALTPEGLAKAGRSGGGRGWSSKHDALKGIELADIDSRARRQLDLPSDLHGALVTSVEPDSAAAEAGLAAGDVILEINRRRVNSADEASDISRQAKGGRLLLRVWHEGGSRFVVLNVSKNQ